MTKTFCDICTREINPTETRYRLTADTITHLVYRSDDICSDCLDKINDYIARLNPNWGKDKDGD